jgi:osmoprotectant transport system permease protein
MNASLRLAVQPAVVLVAVGGVLVWAFARPLTAMQRASLTPATLAEATGRQAAIVAAVALLVAAAAIPLGTALSRKRLARLAPVFLALANIGAAAPAIGLIVLSYLATGSTGFATAVVPIAVYAVLPVLRNTILGFRQIDPALRDAARGVGMSPATVLWRIEFPLALPFVLAGLRVALVLAAGTSTLAFLVGAGGLGQLVDTGYKLRDNVSLVVGAVLAGALALLVDWLGALAEHLLGPKGLR